MFKEFTIATRQQTELINIDSEVQRIVSESGIEDGLCCIFIPHTTAGITINENADPDVVRDIIMETGKVIPLSDGYRHMEGNSAAHIKSSLFGASETVIIRSGRLHFGTWQSLFFCEFDGPRRRKVFVKILE
ncbi:secondary thiamine-phosphate synthase enzyme YjbQ [candidate division KSB1 bacterium]